jgi:hypothetical protein
VKTFLMAGATMFAAGCAYAQMEPPAPPVVVPTPITTPVPPNACVWAGLIYSNGAQFCIAPKLVMKCNLGSWSVEPSSVTPDPCANFQPR